ncbi:peptidase MA family metallohydrolase [Symbiobacterium terraclitae]|uniref:peptidase MA family metallohydrolase n=1 Tax=Symbiobacterium terraclitae TaxID=557451 RepID=UPI0035B534DF
MRGQRVNRGLLASLVAAALVLCVLIGWAPARAAVYRYYREHGRARALAGLPGFDSQGSERFVLYYRPEDADLAALILEVAEAAYSHVVAQVGHRPEGRVPLIVYADRAELRAAFGWGSDQSAVGVYWRGTVRLLSPRVWLAASDESELRESFLRRNPLAHELTHYVLDELTDGNYPRWFTEGLAQRVEEQATGYLWLEPGASLDQALYTLEDLAARFDALPNQALAYRQSYLLVSYIAERWGEGALAGLIARLGEGVPFERAVQLSLDRGMPEVYRDWLASVPR